MKHSPLLTAALLLGGPLLLQDAAARGVAVFGSSSPAHAVVPAASGLSLANRSFTVEFWIRRTARGTAYVMSQGSSATNKGFHVLYRGDSALSFAFYGNDLDVPITDSDIGYFIHWACTYDIATRERVAYRNGVEVARQSGIAPFTGTGDFNFGGWSGTSPSFSGALDDVRIWGTALSAETIAGRYFRDLSDAEAADPNLMAYFRMDALENLGVGNAGANDLRDSGPAGRHATATGSAVPSLTHWRPVVLPGQTPALTIPVTSTAATGAGTLQAAVDAIHAAPDADALYAVDLTALSGTITPAAEFSIRRNTILTGPGSATLTLSGGSAHRSFVVYDGATLTLRDVTVANGKVEQGRASDGVGGRPSMGAAVFTYEGGHVEAEDCVFRNNQVRGQDGGLRRLAAGGLGGNGGYHREGGIWPFLWEDDFAATAGAKSADNRSGGAAGIFTYGTVGRVGGAGTAGVAGADASAWLPGGSGTSGGGGGGGGAMWNSAGGGGDGGAGGAGGRGGAGGYGAGGGAGGGGGGGGGGGTDNGDADGVCDHGYGGYGGSGGSAGSAGRHAGAGTPGESGGRGGGRNLWGRSVMTSKDDRFYMGGSSGAHPGSGGGGAGLGGAIFISSHSTIDLQDVIFVDNRAEGGMPGFNNAAVNHGKGLGAAYFLMEGATHSTTPTGLFLTNNVSTGGKNTAAETGEAVAIYSDRGVAPEIDDPLTSVAFAPGGALHVTIEPAAAAALATWQVAGMAETHASGALLENVSTGSRSVVFSAVPGWIPAKSRSVRVIAGDTTELTATYQPAPEYSLAVEVEGSLVPGIAEQRVEVGGLLAFTLGFRDSEGVFTPATEATMTFPDGTPLGPVSLTNGWFTYAPDAADRVPFTVSVSTGGQTWAFTVSPSRAPQAEHEILRLSPETLPPSPAGRDYQLIQEVPVNGTRPRIVLSGRELTIESANDTQLYALLNTAAQDEAWSAIHLYAEKVTLAAPLNLRGANLHVYAREFVITDSAAYTALTDTGSIDLQCEQITIPESTTPRFLTRTGQTLFTPLSPGALALFVDVSRTTVGQLPSAPTRLPVGLGWLHPLTLRHVVKYANDLYYLGFYSEARTLIADYTDLITAVENAGYTPDPADPGLNIPNGRVPNLPDAANDEIPEFTLLQFSQLRMELEALRGKLDDNLDFFGNPLGWSPMLSFEVNLTLTDAEIERSMRTLYLSYWLTKKAAALQSDSAALDGARTTLSDENDDLRNEFGNLNTEAFGADGNGGLKAASASLSNRIESLEGDLADIEKRLEQRAKELVHERNNPPFWKSAIRGLGAIAQAIPVFQPALGAAAIGMDAVTRIDEQGALEAIVGGVSGAAAFASGSYAGQAQDLEDEMALTALEGNDKALNAEKLRQKSRKIGSRGAALASGISQVGGLFTKSAAPRDEIEAEIQKLAASDPQLAGVGEQLMRLNEDKQAFTERLNVIEGRLREIPAIVDQNLLAMESMRKSINQNNAVLDPQALGFLTAMEDRSKKRLRQYLYWLAKSYEYRFLEPFAESGEAYDLVSVFDKVKDLADAKLSTGTASHVMSQSDFGALKAVFDDALAQLSVRILNGIGLERTQPEIFELTTQQIAQLNTEGHTFINPVAENRFQPGREGFRIVDMRVTNVDFTVEGGTPTWPSSAKMKICFLHGTNRDDEQPGPVRLMKDGRAFLFNPRREDQEARIWTSERAFSTGTWTDSRPSDASLSLLRALLPAGSDYMQFSRPSAWADIKIERLLSNIPAGRRITINSVEIEAQVDYFNKLTNSADIEVRMLADNVESPFGGIETRQSPALSPRIWVDQEDRHGLQDGRGAINRSFVRNAGSFTTFTAEPHYGQWDFLSWRRLGGDGGWEVYTSTGWKAESLVPAGQLQPLSARVLLGDHSRIFAVYHDTGDRIPATVQSIALNSAASSGSIQEYIVTFSEPVIGVDKDDFGLNGIVPRNGTPVILSVSGSGNTRTVRVDTDGAPVTLALLDDDSVQDYGGNSLAGYGIGNGDAEFTGTTVNVSAGLRALGMTATGFQLEISATPGQTWKIMASPDLQAWTEVGTVTPATTAPAVFTDTTALGEARRFYQIAP